MSVHRGSGNTVKSNRYFTVSFMMIAAVTALLWILYGTCMPSLLRLMGANDTLFTYAMSYMHYINIFLPVAVFSNFIAIFVRADNDPNRAMAGVLLGGVFNIVMDIVLVFPLKQGIGGAALASVIGMLIQVLVASSHFLTKKNGLRFIKPHSLLHSMKNIVTAGIPSFFNEFANGFIVLLFNSLFTGVGQSVQPVISTNYGANNIGRIKIIKRMAYITILIMGVVFSLLGILFPRVLCGVFIDMNDSLGVIADLGVRAYFFAFVPFGINLMTSYYLQAILKSGQSLCISLLRNIILSSVWILIFPVLIGGNSLWFVAPVIEAVTLTVNLVFLACGSKR